jgi:probable F420-dependent oxidoreductase
LTHSALLLGATQRIVIATGIANIYARDAVTMAAAQKTLAEAYPGRFLLGLGVSHIPLVEQIRGHSYGPPVTSMRAYLDGMDRAPYRAVPPSIKPIRVLAALGPMLKLTADRADGAHSYFVPPEHTAHAREILGKDRLLAVEQAIVLETDAGKAREIARVHTSRYLALPNYVDNLRRLGFGPQDLASSGSDRLVDAIVAWVIYAPLSIGFATINPPVRTMSAFKCSRRIRRGFPCHNGARLHRRCWDLNETATPVLCAPLNSGASYA